MTAQILTIEDIKPLQDQIARLTRLIEAQAVNPQPMTVKEWCKETGQVEVTVRRWCKKQTINSKKTHGKKWMIFEDPKPYKVNPAS